LTAQEPVKQQENHCAAATSHAFPEPFNRENILKNRELICKNREFDRRCKCPVSARAHGLVLKDQIGFAIGIELAGPCIVVSAGDGPDQATRGA
jgi:hypothetical protein